MPQLPPYVPNAELVVARNLRFDDSAGIPVTSMLPVGMNGLVVADSPTTGYISRIGAVLSDQIDLYNIVTATLATYGTDIISLQDQVTALQISGTTIPSINGLCYTGNVNAPITTLLGYTITDLCDYKPVLGTTTALSQAILAENIATLNAAPAFSQNSAMAGLSGWISAPTTIADTINNSWLSYLDARAGITTVLNAVTPNCSQVIIDFQPVYSSTTPAGFSIYFGGYSFIPTGYNDGGSTITVTDGRGGVLTTGFDIVTYSQDTGPLFLSISGSTLASGMATYQVTVVSNVANAAIGTTCVKTVIKDTLTSGGNGIFTGNFTSAISGSTSTLTLISDLGDTPAYVGITPKNAYTASILGTNFYYLTYTSSGATITFYTPTGGSFGTFTVDWIAYLTG